MQAHHQDTHNSYMRLLLSLASVLQQRTFSIAAKLFMWPELENGSKAISQVLVSNQPLCGSCQKGKWVTAHDSPEVQRREQRFFLHPSQHMRTLEVFFLPPFLPPSLPSSLLFFFYFPLL